MITFFTERLPSTAKLFINVNYLIFILVTKYYLDTCIWRDYFENRSDKFRPLGDWALELIKKIINEDDLIVYSDLIEEELLVELTKENVECIKSIIPNKILIECNTTLEQLKEAKKIGMNLKIPIKDALHAIIARDNNAIVVTRDKHFLDLQNIVKIKKPEELI